MGRSARRNRNRRRHRTGRRQASVALVVNYLNALPDELKEVIQSYVRFTPAFLTDVLELYERDNKICIRRHGDMYTWDVSRLSLADVPRGCRYSELLIPGVYGYWYYKLRIPDVKLLLIDSPTVVCHVPYARRLRYDSWSSCWHCFLFCFLCVVMYDFLRNLRGCLV